MDIMKKKIWLAIFIIYIVVVLKLTIFRESTYVERQLNLTVFINLINVYKNYGMWQFLRLFLGNIGWFVPFGFLFAILVNKKSIIKIAMYGFVFSFAIEALQFIFKKGVAEIDDLILNTVGVLIGYYAALIFLVIQENKCYNRNS